MQDGPIYRTDVAVGSEKNSNCVRQTEGPVVTSRLTANPDIYVTLAASYGESGGGSYYAELRKNFSTSLTSTPELKGHIQKIQQMHEVSAVEFEDFTQPTEIFTYHNEFKPTELADEDTTPAENNKKNGSIMPHGTQPSLSHSPLTDYSVPLEPPSLLHRVNDTTAACLSSMANHPEVHLKAAENTIFSVYQDWVHQNPGTQLDGGINKYGKWKDRWKNLSVCQINATIDCLTMLGGILSQPSQQILMAYELRNGMPSR